MALLSNLTSIFPPLFFNKVTLYLKIVWKIFVQFRYKVAVKIGVFTNAKSI